MPPLLPRPLRIAIAGLHIESSTFSPHVSTAADFTVTRGSDLLARYDWLDAEWARDVAWLPVMHARALPGGAVAPEVYAAQLAEIVSGLRDGVASGGPLDGVLLDIHGAMSVIGMEDVEGHLVQAVREVVGLAPLVSAAMDLHGNVSHTFFEGCDLMTCYRTAPHVDTWETRERAARNLVDAVRAVDDGAGRPHKALVHVPILLPGEMTSTRTEPAAGLYSAVPEVEARDGVTDAAIWIGYAWADEPRCTAAVVVTGTAADAVAAGARDLAEHFWRVRDEFDFVAPTGTFDECLAQAVEAVTDPAADGSRRPFFISDSGDNPGAGGADDVTYALSRLLADEAVEAGRVRAVHVSLVDPAAVSTLAEVALGAPVTVTVGGRIDTTAPGPVELHGVLEARADDPDGGEVVSIRVGGLSVVVTSRRMQYHSLSSYRLLGLDPSDPANGIDVVVVKIGYLEPELYDCAGNWLLALTPGGVDQDLARLPYQRIHRPMHPLDRDVEADLTPRVVSPVDASPDDASPDDASPGDAPPAHRDAIDDHVAAWTSELPWLDPVKEAILTRMAKIVRHVTQYRSGLILDEDLSLREYKALVMLRRGGAPYEASPSDLADIVGLTRGAMSQRLGVLEERGFVERRPFTDEEHPDGRRVTVALTELGLKTIDRLMTDEERYELTALTGLSPDERDQLATLLRKVTHALDDH